MRIRTIIILSSLLLLMTLNIYSQTDEGLQKVFGSLTGYALDRNQVQFNPPENFIFNIDSIQNRVRLECICAKEVRGKLLSNYSKCIFSEDSNFVVYVDIPCIYCKRNDSVYIEFELSPEWKIEMNTYYTNYIKTDFSTNTAKKVTTLSGLPPAYKSSKYARKSFNADLVITYPLRMWEKSEDKYTHCLVMLLQKKYRGCIFLYCLYTDKGAKKLNHYIKSLEKVFWYRDPKDYIKVIEPKRDSIFILPKRDIPPGTMVGCLSSSSK